MSTWRDVTGQSRCAGIPRWTRTCRKTRNVGASWLQYSPACDHMYCTACLALWKRGLNQGLYRLTQAWKPACSDPGGLCPN